MATLLARFRRRHGRKAYLPGRRTRKRRTAHDNALDALVYGKRPVYRGNCAAHLGFGNVREYLGRYRATLRLAGHHGLKYPWAGEQKPLELLWRDLLARREDDRALCPASDPDIAVGVYATDVARPEPAVRRKDLRRLLGRAMVAQHHVRPAHH